MGYSGNPPTGSNDSVSGQGAIIAFMALSIYNALELDIIIVSAFNFKRQRGLYFWSFIAATNGIIPHSIGFLLKNLVHSRGYVLYNTLIAIGWVPMVTGQSLVLYSRLHLLFWDRFYLRLVLGMIVFNAMAMHIPTIVLLFGANMSPDNPWTKPYLIYEKIQVTVFFLQELIISIFYLYACFSFFDIEDSPYGHAVRKMRRNLVIVNVVVVLLDIPILALEYSGVNDLQTAYKAFVYSVKLKMEFQILNELLLMTRSRTSVDPFGGENTSTTWMRQGSTNRL